MLNSYLQEPYTRWKLQKSLYSSAVYPQCMVPIWVTFRKALDLKFLISIDNIWAPLVIAAIMFICNKNRDKIINNIFIFFIPFCVGVLGIDIVFAITNQYSTSNYLLQMLTDVTLMNLYCFAYEGFEGRVFNKADSLQKFRQWLNPFSTLFVVIGGLLGLFVSSFSLRTLILIQLGLDIFWLAIELKLLCIGNKMIKKEIQI